MVLRDILHKCLNSRILKLSGTLFKQLVDTIDAVKSKKMVRNLAVFDFDHTVINDNSDTAVLKLINKEVPEEVKQLHKSDGWTAFMQGVFNTLHENNIKEESINNLIRQLPAVEGMPELIKQMNDDLNYDVIIISDSNSHFIDLWLDQNNLKKYISRVFSNPACFENGLLKIRMYHLQNCCKLSTKNLCKGKIMEDFITEQNSLGVVYKRVVYCGDGINDFCPILRLSKNDLACVRHKYKCVDVVLRSKEGRYIDEDGETRIVTSDVYIWKNGYDILEYVKQLQRKESKLLE
ncbi:hypothetical protein NQ315_005524 [Exocentrus adspersus]|uniref:Pyridoxal phosphate phosphatase PHOSPHO2 n=1 Tax=Exocentrus adspersus TaxID=1586481 RepID=A0AAV8VT22_9CUCU|nr:hypothetical protein NQ315_005524 [Exocentrus adspersus]